MWPGGSPLRVVLTRLGVRQVWGLVNGLALSAEHFLADRFLWYRRPNALVRGSNQARDGLAARAAAPPPWAGPRPPARAAAAAPRSTPGTVPALGSPSPPALPTTPTPQALGVWLMGALALGSADLPDGALLALAPHALAFGLLNQWWLGPAPR